MKYLTPIFLFLTGCAHGPMLQSGSCYRASLNDTETPGAIHDLVTFKVIRIFEYKGDPEYAIQVMDSFGDATYPGVHSYGYSDVKTFDQYISPVVGQFSFADPKAHTIQCNPIAKEDTDKVTRDPPIDTRRKR